MSDNTETRLGLAPDDILERMGGGVESRAMVLSELQGCVEAAAETFRYDDMPESGRLVQALDDLGSVLGGLFLDADGLLTEHQRCRACDGQGSYNQSPGSAVTCEECGGTGMNRAEIPA